MTEQWHTMSSWTTANTRPRTLSLSWSLASTAFDLYCMIHAKCCESNFSSMNMLSFAPRFLQKSMDQRTFQVIICREVKSCHLLEAAGCKKSWTCAPYHRLQWSCPLVVVSRFPLELVLGGCSDRTWHSLLTLLVSKSDTGWKLTTQVWMYTVTKHFWLELLWYIV